MLHGHTILVKERHFRPLCDKFDYNFCTHAEHEFEHALHILEVCLIRPQLSNSLCHLLLIPFFPGDFCARFLLTVLAQKLYSFVNLRSLRRIVRG